MSINLLESIHVGARYSAKDLSDRMVLRHVGELPLNSLQSLRDTVVRRRGTENIFDGADPRAARTACPSSLWSIARRKLDQINRVGNLMDLASQGSLFS